MTPIMVSLARISRLCSFWPSITMLMLSGPLFLPLVGCVSSSGTQNSVSASAPVPPLIETRDVSLPKVSGPEGDSHREDIFSGQDESPEYSGEKTLAWELDLRFLAERARSYRGIGARWQKIGDEYDSLARPLGPKWLECRADVLFLHQGYQALEAGESRDFFALLRRDIGFFAAGCPEILVQSAARLPLFIEDLQLQLSEQARDIVNFYQESGQVTQVLAALKNYEQIRGETISDPALLKIYGHVLLQQGHLQKALEKLIQAVDLDKSDYQLRLEVAQLLLAAGDYGGARKQYLHLADFFHSWEDYSKIVTDHLALLFATGEHGPELEMYRQVLAGYLSFQGGELPEGLAGIVTTLQAKYPGSVHTTEAVRVFGLLEDRVRQKTALRLVEIEKMADAKEFAKAITALKLLRASRLPNDAMQQVVKTQESMIAAQKKYIAQLKIQHEQDLEDSWQEGLNVRDMQLYDDAIAIFTGLLGTKYDAKAATEIDKIANIAAFSLRKKAATLFVKAKRTTNPKARLRLLYKSQDLLEQILSKYPQVKIAEKVEVNLQSIKKQIADAQQPQRLPPRPAPLRPEMIRSDTQAPGAIIDQGSVQLTTSP